MRLLLSLPDILPFTILPNNYYALLCHKSVVTFTYYLQNSFAMNNEYVTVQIHYMCLEFLVIIISLIKYL